MAVYYPPYAAAPPPAVPFPPAPTAPPPLILAARGGLHYQVLGNTFLSGAKMTAEMFLAAGSEAPVVGPLLTLMLSFIKALDEHRGNEEECERLAVWVHALMGTFAEVARGKVMNQDSKPLLDDAVTALQELKTLVESRLERGGCWFSRLKEFWTSPAFKGKMESAEKYLRDALEALFARMTVEMKKDVQMVLDCAILLPQMEQTLALVLGTVRRVCDKVDEVKAQMSRDYGSLKAHYGSLKAQNARDHEAVMRQMERKHYEPLEQLKEPRGMDVWLLESCRIQDDGERKDIVDFFVNPKPLKP